MTKLMWKKGLIVLLSLTVVFGAALQTAAVML